MSMTWEVHARKWSNCTRCPLHEDRKKVVLGMGAIHPKVMAVGQYPGKDEDMKGLPMQGAGGSWTYWAVTKVAGIAWDDCFFANVLGCKPKAAPGRAIIRTCGPRLYELIGIVSPQVILSMGLVAARFFLNDYTTSMASVAGTNRTIDSVPLFFTTHPFEPARQNTTEQFEESKKKVVREFKALHRFLTERGIVEREVE